jgi:hypothetical protein
MSIYQAWLARFLFPCTRGTEPDGRAIYAYRCSDEKYEDLKNLIKKDILLMLSPKGYSKYLPALFCLYAAETFRRKHSEGAWSWDTVFAPLNIDVPYPECNIDNWARIWVEQGLKIWKRRLLRHQAGKGNRAFLLTIACEGGLPLNLLHKQNTNLTQFFRSVLEQYHAQRFGGVDVAEQIANQRSFLLPRSLRQEIVFRLTGELIARVTDLQQQAGNTSDPILVLDRLDKGWRKQLPLSLEDDAAKALLTGLVRQSGEIVKNTAARVLWRGCLQKSLHGWQVWKTLDFPERLSDEQLNSLLANSVSSPIPRLRIVLQTPEGSDTVAWLTLYRQHERTFYRREWLYRAGSVKLAGNRVGQSHKVLLSTTETSYLVSVHNDEAWGDLPWVFIGGETDGKWEWLTEGSATTKQAVALVAVTDDFSSVALNGGESLAIGFILSVGRTLYKVKGSVKFCSSVGGNYHICCQAEVDSDESYRLRGHMVSEALNERPIFRGLPCFIATQQAGQVYQPKGKVQWRPFYEDGTWRMGDTGCCGRVWLRLIDESGTERIRRQTDIVPRNFRIMRTVGTNITSGSYRLHGVVQAQVLTPTKPVLEIKQMGDGIQLNCPALHDANLEPIRLRLIWPRAEAIEMTLPYPQRGAVFTFDGKILPDQSVVPLGRLGGLQLFIQDQTDNGRFTLDVALEGSTLGFRQKLPPLQNCSLQFLLDSERDRLASLLASTHTKDVSVKIQVVSGGTCLAKVIVARFDVTMQPDREHNRVSISDKSLQRLGDDWQSRICLEMIPLWNPCSEPVPLTEIEGNDSVWGIPSRLPPGPWWIIGRDGSWARFRPLLWTVKNLEEGTDIPTEENALPLEAIIKIADEQQRKQHLNNLMKALGSDPEHSDWELITAYIGLSSEFPPSTLDVLTHLVDHPATLALLLLKSTEEDFNKIWSLSEQMPFSWSLIPAKTWAEVAHLYYGTLQNSLAAFDWGEQAVVDGFKQFYKRMTEQRPSWLPLSDWLQEQLFPQIPTNGNSLFWQAKLASFRDDMHQLKELIRQNEERLQERHSADEQWPISHEIMLLTNQLNDYYQYQRLPKHLRPVRCAPFVAAYICLNGIEPPPLLVYELRLIRAFDPIWFFDSYSIAIALGLANFLKEKH